MSLGVGEGSRRTTGPSAPLRSGPTARRGAGGMTSGRATAPTRAVAGPERSLVKGLRAAQLEPGIAALASSADVHQQVYRSV
jgi:hypothetical protein